MQNTQNPKLSIIIPHYHTPEMLADCLSMIFEKIKKISCEIIVSDGESDDKSLEKLRNKYPSVLFIKHKDNVGFSKLVNAGLEKARGEFIFMINADIIIKDEKNIFDMIDYLDKNPKVGLVGPRLYNPDGSVQQTYFREYTFLTILARRTIFGEILFGKKILGKFAYKDKIITGPFEPDWILGAAFITKKDRLEKIGGKLDKRYFMYFEDADLCRQFKKSGFKVIYYPFANFIHHHARASDKGGGIADIFFNSLTRVHIISYLKYLWKWRVEKYF